MSLNYRNSFVVMNLAVALAAGLLLIFISGCQPSSAANKNSTPTSSITITATTDPARTPIAKARPTPTVTVTATPEDATISLTFWTVEPISPQAEGEPGNFIRDSLRRFDLANSNIEVNLLLKKATGKGGVVDFLRTAKAVAPSVLPDLAIMDATNLAQAYNDGLLQPLDGRLDRSVVQDLLPAARKIGTVDDRLMGVPLGVDMEHLVYNTLVFTTTPMLWTDVLSSNTQYLFPAKGVNGLVNDATLAQYFSTGGEFLDDQQRPKIDEQALRDVLDFYQQALENNQLSPEILAASTTEELWPIYLEARAGMANISVRQYLTDRELLNNSTFAALPVQNDEDTAIPIAHAWVMVLVTEDVNRQKAALSLIEWFLSTRNNADWNNINKSIPTRDTAFQQLAGDDPYWTFLAEQLNMARLQPGFSDYDRIGRIIQQAVEQVISGEASPDEATATAIDAFAQ